MAKRSKSNETPKSDTRNVVSAEGSESVDLEDQLASIWDQNKQLITYGIIGIFVIFAGYYVVKFLGERAEQSIQAGYVEAEGPEEKSEWAQGESGHPLSGFAYKQLADEAYKEQDFQKAADLYGKAVKSTKSAIQDAAQLGLAMSHLQNGEETEAKNAFSKIAKDEKATNRLEAWYQLASLAKQDGDFSTAREHIEQVQSNASQENFYWLQKAMILQSELPPEEETLEEDSES